MVSVGAVVSHTWRAPSDVTRAIDEAIHRAGETGAESVVGPQAAGKPEQVMPADAATGHTTRAHSVQDEIPRDVGLPADSGSGRRVVYSEAQQRVWLVSAAENIEATYLVSGSAYDNLEPGTFTVYSRSETANSFDGASTMAYFVRFTTGPTGAAIGFHDIPVMRTTGEQVQSVDDLGTPLSHGCIRQLRQDAATLWEFAPIGTTVVVTG
jgi:L,D-transpeptidase catalytic domain